MRTMLLIAAGLTLAGCQSTPTVSRPAATRPALVRPAAAVASPARETIGKSVNGQSIELIRLGSGPARVLLIGGVHGDEAISSQFVERFVAEVRQNPKLLAGRSVLVVPRMNPDGLEKNTRQNARGVDLNRNLPSKNWKKSRSPKPVGRDWPGPTPASEPETIALMKLLDREKPALIVTVHAMHRGPCNNYDGPAKAAAEAMASKNGYEVLADIGYPTPGSLGSFAGVDRSIGVVTLELPTRGRLDLVYEKNRDALLAGLSAAERQR
jgi:murein peptide amidase A